MKASIYNLKDHTTGDTFVGVEFKLKRGENQTPMDLTGAAIKIQFRLSAYDSVASKTVQIGSGITIVSATEGRFRIDNFLIDLLPNLYHYDIQITTGSVVKTYVQGTFRVNTNITI